MTSILGQQGAMIFWAVVAVACLVGAALRMTGFRPRDSEGGWLQDKARSDAHRVSAQMSPAWMQGRFGTIVYCLLGGAFLVIVLSAVTARLVQGPAPAAQTANSTDQTHSTGAF